MSLTARCGSCGVDLPPTAKFCHECGEAQPGAGASPPRAEASRPAAERAPRDYTPRHLAERVLTSRAALEGERKQVTVLFADVMGSLGLAERVGAEPWHRILDRFFALVEHHELQCFLVRFEQEMLVLVPVTASDLMHIPCEFFGGAVFVRAVAAK